MINLTCELLNELREKYPYSPLAHGLQSLMDYPYSRNGFCLGITEDNTRLCIVIDQPEITDDKVFGYCYTSRVIKQVGYIIILLKKNTSREPTRHQLFYGTNLKDQVQTSIGFKVKPSIKIRVPVTRCILRDDTVVNPDDLSEKGVFLEVTTACPYYSKFRTLPARETLTQPIKIDGTASLSKTKDGCYSSYVGKYIDIQNFM